MDAKRLVEFGDERRRQLTYTWSDPLDSYRADLLGLGFEVSRQSGLACRQQHLECVKARDVRGHRYDGDHPRPSRVAVALAASLLTTTAGRVLLASDPRAGSGLTVTISPWRMSASQAVRGDRLPGHGLL